MKPYASFAFPNSTTGLVMGTLLRSTGLKLHTCATPKKQFGVGSIFHIFVTEGERYRFPKGAGQLGEPLAAGLAAMCWPCMPAVPCPASPDSYVTGSW